MPGETDCAVECAVFRDVELGLNAVEGGQTRLGVEVNREDTIAMQREILREVRCMGRLTRAAFEVGDSEHHEAFALPGFAAGNVFAVGLAARVEVFPELLDIAERV